MLLDACWCARVPPSKGGEAKASFQLSVMSIQDPERIFEDLDERLSRPKDKWLGDMYGEAPIVAVQREYLGAGWSGQQTLNGAWDSLRERVAERKQERLDEDVKIGRRGSVRETLVDVACPGCWSVASCSRRISCADTAFVNDSLPCPAVDPSDGILPLVGAPHEARTSPQGPD